MRLIEGGKPRKRMRSSLDLWSEEGKTGMEEEREPADYTPGTRTALEKELGGRNVLNAKVRSFEKEGRSGKNVGPLCRRVERCTRACV